MVNNTMLSFLSYAEKLMIKDLSSLTYQAGDISKPQEALNNKHKENFVSRIIKLSKKKRTNIQSQHTEWPRR